MNSYLRTITAAVVISAASQVCFGQFVVDWYTIDGGGAINASGGTFALSGTVAQPDARSFSTPMSGGTFSLVGGFWPVAAGLCTCLGDVNGDGLRNGRDVQQFVGCVMNAGGCSCADMDQANGVNLTDVSLFVAALLAAAPCP
jgi:hypothetical protein